MLFIFQETSWLLPLFRFFIDPNFLDEAAAEGAAESWFFAAIVITAFAAALVEVIKWALKERAPLGRKRWAKRKVFGFMLLGFLASCVGLLVLYWLDSKYSDYLKLGGLVKGIVFTWLLGLVVMFIADMVIPRFRSDYGW